jgi:hypothetical protein
MNVFGRRVVVPGTKQPSPTPERKTGVRARHVCQLALLALAVSLAVPAAPAAATTLSDAVACRKKVTSQGKAYANKRRRLLLSCIDKLLKCDLRFEVEGTDPTSCRSRAHDSCNRQIGPAVDSRLNTAKVRFTDRSSVRCAAFTAESMCSTAAGGLWFGNDATCGTSNPTTCGAVTPTVAPLMDCIRDEIDVQVDSVVGGVKPRGGFLLDNVDVTTMGAPVSLGSLFPNLPRPPTKTVEITASGGPLDPLGTIALGAGEALKVFANANVSCGGGMNGKVTISVGPGIDCPPDSSPAPLQQYVIKEDYGSERTATFGPFATDQTYCIERKDGGMSGCMDEITGTIDVP